MTAARRPLLIAAGLAALALAGCSRAPEPQAAAAALPAQQEEGALSQKEFMAHVVAYTAQSMWSWQGWVYDEQGEHSLFPKNDEEWEEAEGAALTLAELMGILLQPGRRIEVPGWDESALEVRALARRAAQAAETHDEMKFFELGTEIQEACEGCHRAVGIAVY